MSAAPSLVPASFDPTVDLPDEQYIREHLSFAIDLWRPRNDFFKKVDEMLEGRNAVYFSANLQYEVRVTHTFALQAVVAEKAARFMLTPDIEAVSLGASTDSRTESTRFENWMNSVFYWMEVQGDGDVWSRMIMDAIPKDMAVERIEFAPAPFWPELVCIEDEHGRKREKLSILRPYQDEEDYQRYREKYKQTQSVPFRTVYVKPENFFPLYDGPTPTRAFEIEKRSLGEVMRNKVFDVSQLRWFADPTNRGSANINNVKQEVTIVHFTNQNWHAYYALVPGMQVNNGASVRWPDAQASDTMSVGQPVLLHAYEHNLGRLPYNIMGGRNGGWKGPHNAIEGVMNALLQINQDMDEVASQVLTNIRNVYWPTLIAYYDPENRDVTDGPPKAPNVRQGDGIGMWKTEKLEPLFQPIQNPVLQWFWSNLVNQHERLSGSAATFGQQAGGVNTGYQANLQVSQAEHLDDKLEQHFAQAAVQRAMILIAYVKQSKEKMWVPYLYTNSEGKRQAIQIALDPAKLEMSIPQMSAQVRKPRPIDYVAAVRAALDATADRSGPGTPLLDDDTARERILGEKSPDLIEQKVMLQNTKKQINDSGVIQKKVMERLNLLLVQDAAQNVTQQQVQGADPALLQTLGQRNVQSGTAAANGGVQPGFLATQMEGAQAAGQSMVAPPPGPGAPGAGPPAPSPMNVRSAPPPGRMGTGGGSPAGTAQPQNDIGRAIQMAAANGRM